MNIDARWQYYWANPFQTMEYQIFDGHKVYRRTTRGPRGGKQRIYMTKDRWFRTWTELCTHLLLK